ICEAVDPRYQDLGSYSSPETDKLKKSYVENLRVHMASVINPEVAKQELYDHDTKKITERVVSDAFFNPFLFYRFAEEYFNINLVMFNFKEKKEEGLRVKFLIPRNKGFYVRNDPMERRTVCVGINRGSPT